MSNLSSQIAANRFQFQSYNNPADSSDRSQRFFDNNPGSSAINNRFGAMNQGNRSLLGQEFNNEVLNTTPNYRTSTLDLPQANLNISSSHQFNQQSLRSQDEVSSYDYFNGTRRLPSESLSGFNKTPSQFSSATRPSRNYYSFEEREPTSNNYMYSEPSLQNRRAYNPSYDQEISANTGYNNDYRQFHYNQHQAQTYEDQNKLPSILLNTAMGKSPTSAKQQLNFFQSSQNSPFSQSRIMLQKRPVTPEGLPIPKSKRYNYSNYPETGTTPKSRSSYHGSINNDELPPVATFDDDETLRPNQPNDSDLFGFETSTLPKSNTYDDLDRISSGSRATFFDNDWAPEDVIENSLLIFGVSKKYSKVMSENFEQYGPLKAIMGAPENGNWAVVVFEYAESAKKLLNTAQVNGGKILIDNGRVLLGIETASVDAIQIAKNGQYHMYIKSRSVNIPQVQSSDHRSTLANRTPPSNTPDLNQYSQQQLPYINSRVKPRRFGPAPPRRQSLKPNQASLHTFSPLNHVPKSQLPFPNSPANFLGSVDETKPRGDENQNNGILLENRQITNKTLTPLNIKPRSSLLQSAVDMLFGW